MKKGSLHIEESKEKIREANLGKHHTEETKQKMRKSKTELHKQHMRQPRTELHKQHLRDSHLGYKHTEEAKRKMRSRKHSEETKQKMRDNHPHLSGEDHPMFGKHHTEESKRKIGDPQLGKVACNKGISMSKETKQKMSDFWIDKKGKESNAWNGGRDASERRHSGRGFIPINKNFIGAEGHHLDTHFMLYIPKELHRSVYHNLYTGQGMKEINDLAIRYTYGKQEGSRW